MSCTGFWLAEIVKEPRGLSMRALRNAAANSMASRHLRAGSLRMVFGPAKSVRVKAHFAVYPPRHAKRQPVEAFLAWLHGEAARTDDA